ncbi:MAG: hypothetical protein ACQESR_06565 [Planctomycetota bacterium]
MRYTSDGRICPGGKRLDASALPLVGLAADKVIRDRYGRFPPFTPRTTPVVHERAYRRFPEPRHAATWKGSTRDAIVPCLSCPWSRMRRMGSATKRQRKDTVDELRAP